MTYNQKNFMHLITAEQKSQLNKYNFVLMVEERAWKQISLNIYLDICPTKTSSIDA
jgi:hypothetical protein